jgi:ubiquinone/menaquinone biosynthesis C-methylase UbiE
MSVARTLAFAGVILAGLAVAFVLWQRRSDAAEIERLARELRLEPGARIADVGAGNGAFAIAIAQRVGSEGQVFATELDHERLRQIGRAADKEGVRNLSVIEGAVADTGLAESCCDGVYLRGVYHHLSDPRAIDESLHRAIEPGGRLVIIDFEANWFFTLLAPVEGVPDNRGGHGVPPEVVVEELTAAGFELERRIDDWGLGDYALVFCRP